MQSESENSESEEKKLIIPKTAKDLKACQQCGLILTTEQWNRERECFNRCNSGQTKSFSGMICVLKPSKSWVMRKLGNPGNIYPGLYAIDVQAD